MIRGSQTHSDVKTVQCILYNVLYSIGNMESKEFGNGAL